MPDWDLHLESGKAVGLFDLLIVTDIPIAASLISILLKNGLAVCLHLNTTSQQYLVYTERIAF